MPRVRVALDRFDRRTVRDADAVPVERAVRDEVRAPAQETLVEQRSVFVPPTGAAEEHALRLVAVAASRAHHTPGVHAGVHQPPSGVGDYLFSIFAVIVVSGALFLLYLWFSERDLLAENRRRRQGKGMYKALFLLLLILAVAPVLR